MTDKITIDAASEREGVFVVRGGAYLLDEHAGVLIDSAGNFSAKTKGYPRSLVVLLRSIADDIADAIEDRS